jgi:hypothetical protein
MRRLILSILLIGVGFALRAQERSVISDDLLLKDVAALTDA